MWSDLNSEEKRNVKHDAIAMVVVGILVMIGLVIYRALPAQDEPYEPECTDLYEHSSSPKECTDKQEQNDG